MANIFQVRETEIYAEKICWDCYKVEAYEREDCKGCSIYTKVTIYKASTPGQREQSVQELKRCLTEALRKLEELTGPVA